MARKEDVLTHLDRLIANKREKISQYAKDLAVEMERLSVTVLVNAAETRECPIQYNATYINTMCGELNALIEAQRMLKAVA